MLHTVLNPLNNPSSVPLFLHQELCLGAAACKLHSLNGIEGCRLHKGCALNTALQKLKRDQDSKRDCLNSERDGIGLLEVGNIIQHHCLQ